MDQSTDKSKKNAQPESAQPENSQSESEQAKKRVLLRLAPSLWEQVSAWAEDDFRSINGQIEYLLSEAVKKRHGKDGKDGKD